MQRSLIDDQRDEISRLRTENYRLTHATRGATLRAEEALIDLARYREKCGQAEVDLRILRSFRDQIKGLTPGFYNSAMQAALGNAGITTRLSDRVSTPETVGGEAGGLHPVRKA